MTVEKAGAATYRMGIRNAVRGLWTGAIDMGQFLDMMGLTIGQGLGAAFAEGASACGIKPDEYSDTEQQALREFISNEEFRVYEFGQIVEEGSKANGGKLSPLFQRAEMWILRYQDVVNQARTLACSDGKFRWELGGSKVHCSTCARLHGQVRRGSFWRDHVLPQNPPNRLLECEGWNCKCQLVPTNAALSRGRLPRTP